MTTTHRDDYTIKRPGKAHLNTQSETGCLGAASTDHICQQSESQSIAHNRGERPEVNLPQTVSRSPRNGNYYIFGLSYPLGK